MLIVGAGGHARDILQVLLDNKYGEEIYFFDNVTEDTDLLLNKYKIIHSIDDVAGINNYCLGVGNPKSRKKLDLLFKDLSMLPENIISSRAFVSPVEAIGKNVTVMPFSYVVNSSSIGYGTLINCHAAVGHDVHIGEYCEIAPGVRLLGGVGVGNYTSIYTNAVVFPNIKIGSNCVIGAGAMVTKEVPDNCVVHGNPARVIRKNY